MVPEGVTNLGLLGQYVELERDIAFTFEYSTRTAWEAIYRLLEARSRPSRRLPGPVRSEGRVGGCESVSGSDEDLGGEARARPGTGGQSVTALAMEAYLCRQEQPRLAAQPSRRPL